MYLIEFQRLLITGLLFITDQLFYWQLFSLLQGFAITFLIVPVVVIFARKFNLLYKPNNRSSHANPVPALGGIAIFAGFIITFQLITSITKQQSFTIIIATSLIFLVGLIDDLVEVKPWRKLIIIILLSLFITQTQGLTIDNFHGLFSINQLNKLFSIAVTVFVIAYITNAINLIDGVDGLASGLGITILSIFSYCFYHSNNIQYLSLTLPMIASLTAFLLFNIWGRRYKIFMGDSGSLLLGLIVAVSLIRFMKIGQGAIDNIGISPVTAFAVLIIPVYDAIHVSIKRLVTGRPLFKPDKGHIHHTYLKLGFTHRITSLILVVYTIIFFFLSQILLKYFNDDIALGILIVVAILLWGFAETLLRKYPRKFALRRYNYLTKISYNTGTEK